MSSNTVDPMAYVATAADLEIRCAKIADPGIDLKTKNAVACEIREMLDTTRDSETIRVLPYLIPTLLELLKTGEASFRKDTLEYQFRRVLVEILHRLPTSDVARPHLNPIFECLFHLVRHDNEENAALACKTLIDHVRNYRCLTEDKLSECTTLFIEGLGHMSELTTQLLSEDSVALDPEVALRGLHSFKVMAEMGLVMVMFTRARQTAAVVKATIDPTFEVIELESPAQKKVRNDCEAMGNTWAGMAPTVKNSGAYSDFINAQIKLLSYLVYILRQVTDQTAVEYGERLTLIALRLLQDCPATSIPLRKDLMVVFRHLIGTPHRRVLVSQIDKLFDERILLGTGIGNKEMLRTNFYTAVADLFHHLKGDLSFPQLSRLVHMHLRIVHNPMVGMNVHILCAKILFGLPEAIVAKDTHDNAAARLLEIMFQSCLDRLIALTHIHDELVAATERRKNGDEKVEDAVFVEKARPVGGASFALEKPEEVMQESRLLFKLLLHGFRVTLINLKKCNAPLADGTLIFRVFVGCIRCMSYLEPDARMNEPNDAIDWFALILLEVNLHVFQEVWTQNVGYFFECAQKKVVLMNVCQFLFAKESTSPTLLAIILKFLVDRLPELGEYDDLKAAATIRLYKMAFGAVAAHPASNEPILASHLAKLLMDCFPLATKATKPTHYFHLLRALFRAIGGGGGRFELLYKEVLPLLPDMLDCLNKQLLASEGQTRDMIVELCLTVPLRLTHLLPHLSYLMQPLALALRGSQELVSQGLRTLELCIDNLTPDFLDPTLSIVLRELMEALHSHLKPLPSNHLLSHTTVRILGKLGGRNRRLLSKEPALEYIHHSDVPKVTISFGGSLQKLSLEPVGKLVCRLLSTPTNNSDTSLAYDYLEKSLCLMVHDGVKGRNVEEFFTKALEAVFDATFITDTKGKAEQFIRKLALAVFDMELRKVHSRENTQRTLLLAFLDAIPHAIARENAGQAKAAQNLMTSILEDLVAAARHNNTIIPEIYPVLHQIANRFCSLCFDHAWSRKAAGCIGIEIMTTTPEVGGKWVRDRGGDLVRTLIHVLKDLPTDFPDVANIVNLLTIVIKMGSPDFDLRSVESSVARSKLLNLAGILFPELSSINPIVRQAVQTCIGLLVEYGGLSAMELLTPHRERIVVGIYAKPLRALPFPIQIGIIEAVRYLISLDPPLLELNDELLRLLHETLALADADDNSLLSRNNVRQGVIEMTKLRVVSIKLLTASMPLTDFFSRQHQTRQRVTGVYFKSLYSPSLEVKDVAHEGLRMVLLHQSKLPKELLQTGLRPILMNLADPKRLSVPGLEGLARLLELLTNYFKVEIGHKLLDHFRIVADPQMLQASSRSPLGENEGITKLVRLANIFHLLPSSANIFLENLVNAVVQTEAQMHFSGQSPFSEPLAKYLDRYPEEGVDFFIRHLKFPRHLRTFRSILQAGLAPNLLRVLASRTHVIVQQELRGHEQPLPALSLLCDLAMLIPDWIREHEFVISALLDIWRSSVPQVEAAPGAILDIIKRHELLMDIFRHALQDSPRIDLVFEVIIVYTRNLEIDLNRLTTFLYKHVALSEDVFFQRSILLRFLCWFDTSSATWSHKASFMRYVLTPTILVHAHRFSSSQHLIDASFINRVHRLIWRRVTEATTFADADDMFKIEVLHFTTVLVQHYSHLVGHLAKDLLKCSWHYIGSTDDHIVKQTAYLLNARFFAAFPSPSKFILRTWTGLLRAPSEGTTPQPPSTLRSEGLIALAPSLSSVEMSDNGYPQWAVTARRLLAEEGLSQLTIFYLIVKLPVLFYPVRKLFVTYIVNSLHKLGLIMTSTTDSRLLSIDLLQVIFNWEQQALEEARGKKTSDDSTEWFTPLGYRENIVSYLVRLATLNHEIPGRNIIMSRAIPVLQQMIGPNGWTDVAFGLRYFSRALEQSDFTSEPLLINAVASAKTLQIISTEQDDAWYIANASTLEKLVRKGMTSDDHGLHDALHPIFERLVRLFPLPKEEEEQQGELSEFHAFIYSAIGEGLRNTTGLRGVLLMLKSVVEVVPERIESFSQLLMKLLGKVLKEHINAPLSAVLDSGSRMIISILDICQLSMAFLGEQRKWMLSNLVVMVEKSKNLPLCQYILNLVKTWTLIKQDTYPTMKEKAQILLKLVSFESRADNLFHSFLELVYEIYTEPTLRRSDLTSRLEPLFFVGCRAKDSALRERFMDLLDVSVPRSLFSRLTYICGVQNWEPLADHNWIYLALHLLLGAADVDAPDRRNTFVPPTSQLSRPKTQHLTRPMQHLVFLDSDAAHDLWVSSFSAAWSCLSRREQGEISLHMINLLSKDYHIKQSDIRPNVIQTLLSGILECSPPVILPPHLVKYLAKTFGAWHVSLGLLTSSLENLRDDEPSTRDYIFDSLADLYSELAEDDLFYGLCRRRSLHRETEVAIAFEQNGMWEQAITAYESAQSKARSGAIPFSESEYCLWEDHWILASEKLQQWDVLYDLGRNEGNHDLMLESAWRTTDWVENRVALEEHMAQLPEVTTPRRRVFEAFLALLKNSSGPEKNADFTRILEDAMQMTLRKWVALPPHLSTAHVPLLQHFQQFVELQEAVQIFASLHSTTAQNLEKKSAELKMVLQAWRERLPNIHDDISIWSDLVAWRQNVFHAINNVYIPLISGANQGATNSNANTSGYRGYHETAWIINRFAHVARKHDLLEVCFTSLAKIYTLPNIEISEAFLKLREQARCYYQKPNDLQSGLEVINNTNLVYFSTAQKAEFFTLKGMFHARFGRNDDANTAFGQAVQTDMNQAKSWAEWGRYNDRMFKDQTTDLSHAANAVSCYLQAAGLYKNGKSRPLLTRVLWLLSVDDNTLTISRAFDTYKGDAAFWFWITLIPQLCTSLTNREFKQARYLLFNLARHYPQALFFHLRTTREEISHMKRMPARPVPPNANPAPPVTTQRPIETNTTQEGSAVEVTSQARSSETNETVEPQRATPNNVQNQEGYRPTWECVEEIVQLLKTAFPLLTLSLETIVDQLITRFKQTTEENIYHHIFLLLNDAMQNYTIRMNQADDDGLLSPQTAGTLTRVYHGLPQGQTKKDWEEDFINNKMTHYEYIKRLQRWRDKYESLLDSRPMRPSLDILSHYLTEFQYNKVDEIEVPGQYTEDKDNNQNFVRIQRLDSKFEYTRSQGHCWRRITIIGSDNSKTSFTVQNPYHRTFRREERVTQIFRTFNGVLARKKEGRKRNLFFHMPATVSCSPIMRLYQSDPSYISFSDIFDLHCQQAGFAREDPVLFSGEKVRKVLRDFRQSNGRTLSKVDYLTLKKGINDEVTAKMVPEDILTRYMIHTMVGPGNLWRMRKQFALQLASVSFMIYILCMASRQPSRFTVSRSTGLIVMTDLYPGLSNQQAVFATNDVVPFRLTPALQHFITPIFIEGILTSSLMAMGRSLTEPEFALEQQLCLFARDEVFGWLSQHQQHQQRQNPQNPIPPSNMSIPVDLAFRQHVSAMIDGVVSRAETMACKVERDQALQGLPMSTPVITTVVNLISSAMNPVQLTKMGDMYIPWF